MGHIIAVLDTMWGRQCAAPRFFRGSPHNHTCRRLYKFIGPENSHRLFITNVCPQSVSHAHQHGTPDPKWLAENLARVSASSVDLILVCGKVAQKAFRESGVRPTCDVMKIPHPASRMWTKKQLRRMERKIQRKCKRGRNVK